jgi:hypothetical protein
LNRPSRTARPDNQNSREDGSRGIVTGKTGLAHTRTVVDNEGGDCGITQRREGELDCTLSYVLRKEKGDGGGAHLLHPYFMANRAERAIINGTGRMSRMSRTNRTASAPNLKKLDRQSQAGVDEGGKTYILADFYSSVDLM